MDNIYIKKNSDWDDKKYSMDMLVGIRKFNK